MESQFDCKALPIAERPHAVTWLDLLSEMIDLRSFTNLWFWLTLAVMWSTASHWVLGVPFDMVQRANAKGGQAAADLDVIAHIYVNRLLFITAEAGLWAAGVLAFLLSSMAMLGFVYGLQFAQALFLLAFPMTIVGAVTLRTARAIHAEAATGASLRRRLTRLRLWTQGIGMIAILITVFWGMAQNLSINVPDRNDRQGGQHGYHDPEHSPAVTDIGWRRA